MHLKRQIGLLGGVALVVGGVIGMGAFVLIPLICSKAGSAAWLAVTVALVVSLVSVFPIIQLSSAYPTAGGGFEYGRRLLSLLTGVVFSWWSIAGGASAVALVAYGLIESFAIYLPEEFSYHIAALIVVALFYIIYLIGLKLLITLQVILTIQKLIAILVFAVPLLSTYGGDTVMTLPQNSTFLIGLIVSFNICLGLQIIMELGEEIKEPQKNIPLALIIGAAIILVFYLLIVFAYSGIVGYDKLETKPDLILTAAQTLPAWAIVFIRFGVFGASLTSLNGAAIAIPREIYAQARGGVLPPAFERINSKGDPQNAISLFFGLVLALLLVGEGLQRTGVLSHFFGKDVIEFYGFLTITGIMLLGIGISIAAWRLPKLMPQEYNNAYIRFSQPWLRFFVVVAILSSVFLIVLVSTKWIVPVFYVGVTAVVLAVFRKHRSDNVIK